MMGDSVLSWLFETKAVRVCPEGAPFWYTSGKLGPFYINTHFLYGSQEAAEALLDTIEQAAAGDRLRFGRTVLAAVRAQYEQNAIYRGLMDLLVERARGMAFDFVSGGERRDFFFSLLIADRLGKPHVSIFKDLQTVCDEAGFESACPASEAGLAGKRALHVADLVTEASSYVRAWIPAIEALGAKIGCSLAVVDRDQGGREVLAEAGIPLTTLVKIDPSLFETARTLGVVTEEQLAMVRSFMQDLNGFMRAFLNAHPTFLQEQIALGGKAKERAERCIEKGFDRL